MYSSKIDFIKKILIGIKTEVDIDSSQKQYDINIKSEVLFMHILNSVYGWNLEDANKLRDNFKAIDLIDHDRRCVIQVTSNIKPQKVYDTIQGLKEFKKDTFYEPYADYKLKMFYIDVNVSFSKTILQRFGESELKEEDLLSITHILEKIKNPDICDRVYSTLTKLFDNNSYIKKSETNIEGNITGVGNISGGTVNQTINNYYSDQNKIDSIDDKKLQKELQQYLEQKNEIELIQKLTKKYLPERYSEPIPETIPEIIKFLIAYGKSDKSLPIKCVLNELNEYYGSPLEIKQYIEYLDEVKYKDISTECIENSLLSKMYILVEFLKEEDGLSNVTMWEYYNGEYTQDSKFEPKPVDLEDNESIKAFFDYLIGFFNTSKYRGIELYLEIILPIEDLSKGIKHWQYSGIRKDKKIISKYKYVLRIQDRFRNSSIMWKWEDKWNRLNYNNSIVDILPKLLKNSIYQEELAEEDMAVLTKQQIENITDVLEDIEEYNISIALLHLSNSVCSHKYSRLTQYKIKECRTKISSYICSNHSNVNSDLIFLLDDPTIIPNELKSPEGYLYG